MLGHQSPAVKIPAHRPVPTHASRSFLHKAACSRLRALQPNQPLVSVCAGSAVHPQARNSGTVGHPILSLEAASGEAQDAQTSTLYPAPGLQDVGWSKGFRRKHRPPGTLAPGVRRQPSSLTRSPIQSLSPGPTGDGPAPCRGSVDARSIPNVRVHSHLLCSPLSAHVSPHPLQAGASVTGLPQGGQPPSFPETQLRLGWLFPPGGKDAVPDG